MTNQIRAKLEPLLTAADVAEILKCSQDHVIDLHRKGSIPATNLALKECPAGRPGRRMLRFRPEDVRAFIDAQTIVLADRDEGLPGSPAPAVIPGGLSLLRGRGGRRTDGGA
jgi:hypothetical protein